MKIEISSDHGVDVVRMAQVPREGDFVVLVGRSYEDLQHGSDRVERVRYVLWHTDGVVTIDTDCVTAPAP